MVSPQRENKNTCYIPAFLKGKKKNHRKNGKSSIMKVYESKILDILGIILYAISIYIKECRVIII